MTSSVVQGSVLGPVLFAIYINDLDLAINCTNGVLLSKFADDTKMGKVISTPNDCLELQHAINNLVSWSTRWGMELHPDKCTVIHFGKNNPKFIYDINGVKVNESENVRDLGILISNNSSQSPHINNVTKKAHVVLSQIKRTFVHRDDIVFPKIYQAYVRPLLEYAVEVWNPMKIEDVKQIEKVQRRATRLVRSQSYESYEQRLKNLGMTTLEERRRRGDMIQTFKIINDYSGIDKDDFFHFVRDRHDIETRSVSSDLLVPEKCHLNVRKNFFVCRVVNDWNSLPLHVRESGSVNGFKNNYDDYMMETKITAQT